MFSLQDPAGAKKSKCSIHIKSDLLLSKKYFLGAGMSRRIS
jgi:hypothetical protein